MEFAVIGSAPTQEVARSAPPDDEPLVKRAAEVFAQQVVRQLGEPPVGVEITVERVTTSQGTLYCVVCYYNPASGAAFDYAWRCSSETPQYWDSVARRELGIQSGRE